MINEKIKAEMLNIENLAKAYMMVKNTLATEYGEAFTSLNEQAQAQAVGHVLAELLHI
jgi:hypothetical protein